MASKTPPKFVPTLTEVVELDPTLLHALEQASAAQTEPPMADAPAVPQWQALPELPELTKLTKLTELTELAQRPMTQPEPEPEPLTPEPPAPATPSLEPDFEEAMVHRVMQRVDGVLAERLREAIAQVVEEHTRSLTTRLRQEVEGAVRAAVYEAVEQELAKQVNENS